MSRGQLGTDTGPAGDVNNDGTPDVIAGALGVGADRAYAYSGLDGNVCRFAHCVDGLCFDQPAGYGDIASSAGACGPDGTVDLNGILAVLDGFRSVFADGREFTNINIAGPQGSCEVDSQIHLSDILASLDACQGDDRCCGNRRRGRP